MQQNSGENAEVKTYPLPTSDGFFFEDEGNEVFKIESHVYENGNEVRRVTLSTGKVAIVRELNGLETGRDVERLCKGERENYQFAMIAIATKIGDTGLTMEDVKEMKGKDFTKLQVANAQINF